MSDTDTTPEATTEATEPKSEASGLRAQLEATLAENRELKAREKSRVFGETGLDPNAGLGKAIFKEYDGPLEADAILEYAKTEYQYTPASPQQQQAAQIHEAQGRLDTAAATAGSIAPAPPTPQQIAEAEAAGDWGTAGAIKAAQIESALYKR